MKDFSLLSMLAIAADMLGLWLWPAVAAAAVVALLFVVALWRRRFGGAQLRAAAILGLVGAALAVAVAPFATQASFANLHGAVDWTTLALIGAGAFLAVAVAAFALLGAVSRPA